MAKNRKGPKVAYQVLLIPATDASVDDFVLLNTLRELPETKAALQHVSDGVRDALEVSDGVRAALKQ